ncbi:MAG TPA: nucleotidyltransferase family protein [Hanamia sp.]|nr:nucleotidyltransferase family protein [Hanamia sp.]
MQSSINDRVSLLNILTSYKHEIRNYGVERLGVFGSFAKNEMSHNSDVDLLVEFSNSKKTYDNYFELSNFLQDLLKRKVELVTPQSLSKYLGPNILKQVIDVAI